MKIRNGLVLISMVLFILSCDSQFPGFSRIRGDIYKKYVEFGEGDLGIKEGAFVTLHARMGRISEGGIEYETEYGFRRFGEHALGDVNLEKELQGLVEGDSAAYIFPYKHFKECVLDEYASDGYQLGDTVWIQLNIRVVDVQNEAEWLASQEKEVREGQQEENAFLEQYLTDCCGLDQFIFVDDIYIEHIQEGEGDFIQYGEDVALDYSGYFLNGEEFDPSGKGRGLIYFQLGKPDQVVAAIERTVSAMKEFGKARVYSPSHMAFGRRGSSTGIVPPQTPVYFDLEVKKVFRDSLDYIEFQTLVEGDSTMIP